MLAVDRIIALSCHFSFSKPDEFAAFFATLAEAILAFQTKQYVEVPNWLKQFHFGTEKPLLSWREKLATELGNIDDEREKFDKFKRCLFLGDDALVDAVQEVFALGFRSKTERDEKYKEDL